MTTSEAPPRRPVDAIADAFVDEYAALDPIAATEYGIPGHEHELTDLSPDGFAARDALLRSTLEAVGSVEPTDERERTARDAFVERLALTLERSEAGVPRYEVSVIDSGLHQVRTCFDLMDTTTEEGWRNVDARLARVGEALQGYRTTLQESSAAGQVSAKRQYAEVAPQIRRWTGQDTGSSVFARLVETVPEGTLKPALERHAAGATEAVADFGRF